MQKFVMDKDLGLQMINSGSLYHYTSVDGLKGIVDGKFWITDSEFLNDRKEFRVASEIFTELVNKNIKDTNIKKKIRKAFAKEISLLQGNNQPPEDRCFVLSCSLDCDSMLMWSEYSDFMGYCMEFDAKVLRKAFDKRITYQGKVVYKHDEQIKLLSNYIDNVMFAEDFDERCVRSWEELEKSNKQQMEFFIGNVAIVCFLYNMFLNMSALNKSMSIDLLYMDFQRGLLIRQQLKTVLELKAMLLSHL